MSDNDDVRALHEKFGLLGHRTPGLLTKAKLKERLEFLLEELEELAQAGGFTLVEVDDKVIINGFPQGADQDLALQADALVDLIYVAHGTAVMLGLPMDRLWNDVHEANMRKVRGMTKRGHQVDLAKPEGWVGPRTKAILAEAGYVPGAEEEHDDSNYQAPTMQSLSRQMMEEDTKSMDLDIHPGYRTEDVLSALKEANVQYTKLQVPPQKGKSEIIKDFLDKVKEDSGP